MKNIKFKILTFVMIIAMCLSSSSVAIFAGDINTTDTSITHTEYTISGDTINFTWNPVDDQSGQPILYAIRMWKNSTSYKEANKLFLVENLYSNQHSAIQPLIPTETYRYQVVFYHSGETPVWTSAVTAKVLISTDADLPLPTKFTVAFADSSKAKNTKKLGEIKQKDNTVKIKWTVADPSLYSKFVVHRTTSSGKTTTLGTVKATSNTSYSYKDYAPAGTSSYYLKLYSSQDLTQTTYRATNNIQGPKVPDGYLTTSKVTTNNSWSAIAEQKLTLYDSPDGDAYTTVPEETELDATGDFSPKTFGFWEEPTWVEVEYEGDTYWVKWSQVKMKWHITKKDYAWTVKESFVKKYKSKTSYLIWVSRYTNRTNVFHKENGKWVLKKVYDCNTGNYYQPLKGGQYYINGHESIKYKIHETGREYYFKYSTKFGGSGTFHTRCRWADTNNLRNAIKRHPTTKGCCRLYDEAAQYVYGLPNGTGVVIK